MKKKFLYAGTILICVALLGILVLIYFNNKIDAKEVKSSKETKSSLALRRTHPRILLPELSTWSGYNIPLKMRSRFASYERKGLEVYKACDFPGVMAKTACWITTGNAEIAEQLINELKAFSIRPAEEERNYGNAWELAFAYDFLTLYPGFTHTDKLVVEEKLVNALKVYLQVLASDSPTLWHGRTTLASRAWICAVVLDKTANQESDLINTALDHYLDSFAAVSLTEAWPEGYNYWIQTRAFEFLLAASAYLNGVDNVKYRKDVLETIKRVGLWHIYATRPDNRIEGFGDEGSRIDLKDHTRQTIDLIGQLSKDPVFSLYSRYIQGLHGRQSYYRGLHWSFPLLNDPDIDLVSQDINSLERFNSLLPKSELFGKDEFNQIYLRSSWNDDATFISYRAGHTFSHHGHYDAGHFTVFKGAPLAINSSVYRNIRNENRLNYSIRTVAKNSLLILRPDEKVRPNRFFAKKNVADGGQRIKIPTGSALSSLEEWENNINSGAHLEGARLLHFQNSNRNYIYIASDLTDAYNTPRHDEGGSGGKVNKVTRELLYLTKEDILIVRDNISATEASYKKKWLLHSVNKPQASGLKVLKGEIGNGISETSADKAFIKNNNSYLKLQRFYPLDARIRLVGGPDYQYYVETDGDDNDLDGENFYKGAIDKPWFDVGQWRIEIQPAEARKEDEFLIALYPSIHKPSEEQLYLLPKSKNAKGLASNTAIIFFINQSKKGDIEFKFTGDQKHLYLFGMPASTEVLLSNSVDTVVLNSNVNGIVDYELDSKFRDTKSRLKLKW